MSANLIREIWKVIEQTQSTTLLRLDDGELMSTLLWQLKSYHVLTGAEIRDAHSYLNSRLTLIRDLAWSRLEEESWDLVPVMS